MFCADYGNIPSALYLANQHYSDGAVTLVVIGNHDLFQFFQAINERVFHSAVNLIYLEPFRACRAAVAGVKKAFYIIPDIVRERRYLKHAWDEQFAKLKGWEVFFFSRSFSGHTYYFLDKLSRMNRLTYMPYTPYTSPDLMNSPYTPASIIDLVQLLLLKMIFGGGMVLGKYPRTNPYVKGFPLMSDRFMQKKVARVISSEERSEMLKAFDLNRFKVFDAANYSVIYFDDGLVGSNYAGGSLDKDTFGREMAQIFGILTKYFPEAEIARKYHPGYHSDQSIIATGTVLPDFIPAEFLYNDNTRMYLSICSFSIANVEKGLAVSIIDLISFPSEELRNQLKENLIRASRSKILFPKTLHEFESIVRNITKIGETHRAFTGT
jgi:hypothetical protein